MVADLSFFRATMPEPSALSTGADDALKDLDNTWFLRGQPEDVRKAWFDRVRILRLVDRLAEAERSNPAGQEFSVLLDAWYDYGTNGFAYGHIADVERVWLSGSLLERLCNGGSFHAFIDSVGVYSLGGAALDDVREHQVMLDRMSGAMFQLFPFVPLELRGAIRSFGILDGFFNNIRDLAEDSAAGLCYFPTDVLERHGLTRDDVLTGRCIGTADWSAMMHLWLDEYMPTLRERATPFIEATGLHPSLEALRGWSMHRWRRVESVFREAEYDYRAFDMLYWERVREELAERSEAA